MIGLGIFFGLTMLVSVFLPWETYTGEDYAWTIRFSEFFGIHNSSFDNLFGLDFLPILCALIFIIGISLAKKHTSWRVLALIGSFICFAIGIYNVFTPEISYVPGFGLWLFAITGLLTFVISILILINKNLLEKKLFGKLMDQTN